MLRSMSSPSDAHEDHLRHLLDQRTTRADVYGRFPSVSESSDSPSVYSHPFFSPRPGDGDDVDANASDFGISRPRSSSASELSSPISSRDLLTNTTSILDLDDDTSSSSIVSQTAYDDDESTQEALDDDSHDLRMSMLGPKMRFHSRAPWETGEDTLQEEEGFQEGRPSTSSFKRVRNKSSKGEAIIKGLGLGSSNLKPSSASRPSWESSRSHGKPKRSFESTISQASSPRSALSAQASISSTSLSLALPSNVPHKNPRHPHTVTSPTTSLTSSTQHSPPLPSLSIGHPATGGYSGHLTLSSPRGANVGAGTSSLLDEDILHPYANPDNAVPYSRDQIANSPLRAAFTLPPSQESTVTMMESLSVSSLTRSRTPSTLTLDTVSQTGHRTPSRMSTFHGKEISSPISVVNPALQDNDINSSTNDRYGDPKATSILPAPGMGDHQGSPNFSLISLEEARAQRMRSVTGQTAATSRAATPSMPFPEPGQDTASCISGSSSTSITHTSTRSRGRSISAGAKATKSALQHIVGAPSPPKLERRDSEPSAPQEAQQMYNGGMAGRQLKHKKSGFMRLFNGKEQKEREKERDRSPPPPVPALSDTYTSQSGPSQATRVHQLTTQRIPVTALTPVVLDPPLNLRSDSSERSRPNPSVSMTSNKSSASKRTPPPLTISNSSHVPSAPSTKVPVSSQRSHTTPTSRLRVQNTGSHTLSTQSAPAQTADFPTLSLRPVSALFSAHFAEHIVRTDSPSSPEGVGDGSNSTSTSFSPGPLTPGSSLRSIHEKADVSMTSDDQSAVIQTLQDQLVSAKISWQRHIWELEGQVRDLQAEIKELRVQAAEDGKGYCQGCGRWSHGHTVRDGDHHQHLGSSDGGIKVGIVNRPRPATGTANSARFGGRN